ncbi:MAG: 50S ribosomal protein L9 [Rhodothermaeota bacterium MED-G19]|nr:MAG: 50S ribosomal protein L9 [Rhodothermaeota bacterium MED-G19]
MEIILLKDVPGLGFKDEILNVKNGYGRNFIIPQGYGVLANNSNKKVLEENLKQTIKKQEEILKEAEKLAKKIGDLVLEIKIKTGSEDKIFGSVTTAQIAKMLKEKGLEIHKKNISILTKVNAIGEYDVNLKIHKDLTHTIKINVTGKVPVKKKSPNKEDENKESIKDNKGAESKEDSKSVKSKKDDKDVESKEDPKSVKSKKDDKDVESKEDSKSVKSKKDSKK